MHAQLNIYWKGWWHCFWGDKRVVLPGRSFPGFALSAPSPSDGHWQLFGVFSCISCQVHILNHFSISPNFFPFSEPFPPRDTFCPQMAMMMTLRPSHRHLRLYRADFDKGRSKMIFLSLSWGLMADIGQSSQSFMIKNNNNYYCSKQLQIWPANDSVVWYFEIFCIIE